MLGIAIAIRQVPIVRTTEVRMPSRPRVNLEMNELINMTWVAICTALVFFMQAGFALVEGGLSRAKTSINVIMKIYLGTCLVGVGFWVAGYGLAFGSKAFVNAIFTRNRRHFGPKRKDGARKMRFAEWGELHVARALRIAPVQRSLTT